MEVDILAHVVNRKVPFVIAGRNMNEDNSFLVLAYLWPSLVLGNPLESNFC